MTYKGTELGGNMKVQNFSGLPNATNYNAYSNSFFLIHTSYVFVRIANVDMIHFQYHIGSFNTTLPVQ